MKKILALLSVALLLAMTTVGTATTQPQRIVCIGDSITVGITLGQVSPNNWPHQLQTRLGSKWQVINNGVAGDTTSMMLTRINASLALKPQYVIIAGGINDLFTNPSITEANIAQMCNLTVSHGATPVLCTITPTYQLFTPEQIYINIMNAWIINYAHAHGYTIIDFHSVINRSEIEPFFGIHPNNAGYIAMGNAIDVTIFKGG